MEGRTIVRLSSRYAFVLEWNRDRTCALSAKFHRSLCTLWAVGARICDMMNWVWILNARYLNTQMLYTKKYRGDDLSSNGCGKGEINSTPRHTLVHVVSYRPFSCSCIRQSRNNNHWPPHKFPTPDETDVFHCNRSSPRQSINHNQVCNCLYIVATSSQLEFSH